MAQFRLGGWRTLVLLKSCRIAEAGALRLPRFHCDKWGDHKTQPYFAVIVRPNPLDLRGGSMALGYGPNCEVSTYFQMDTYESTA